MDAEQTSPQEGKGPVIPGTLIVGWALPTPVDSTSSLSPHGLCCVPGPLRWMDVVLPSRGSYTRLRVSSVALSCPTLCGLLD